MCYTEVKCYNCGAVIQIGFDGGNIERCPHCLSKIPRKCIDKLHDAMMCLEEVNKDFRKSHEERGESLFQAEIKNHYVPKDLFNI